MSMLMGLQGLGVQVCIWGECITICKCNSFFSQFPHYELVIEYVIKDALQYDNYAFHEGSILLCTL